MKDFGIVYTYRLYFLVENIAQQEGTTIKYVLFAVSMAVSHYSINICFDLYGYKKRNINLQSDIPQGLILTVAVTYVI